MAVIELRHVNETSIKIIADQSQYMELKDTFSFYTPNYKFHPKYKAGMWDGRISLIDWRSKTILKGLLPEIVDFCADREYELDIDPAILATISPYKINEEKVIEFYEKINAPYPLHTSQMDAMVHTINNGRSIILAPTANGKSYIMHGLSMFYALQRKKVLIIINRSQLVEQLKENLRDEYKGSAKATIDNSYGDTPISECDIYITTWQGCYENDEKWFRQFDVLIADEVHTFKAASLKTIVEKCGHISVRHGFTATLDNGSKTDRLTLVGMFGTPHRVATTRELIEAGIIARPVIYAIINEYSNEDKRQIFRTFGEQVEGSNGKTRDTLPFPKECDFLELNAERNEFIAKIDSKLKGNTLIAFKREKHGKAIVDAIQSLNPDGRPPFFSNHTVKTNVRVEIGKTIDTMNDATGVVSLGTFSTGVNIKNVNNIIIACQIKSEITVPQLIGRGLRLASGKWQCNVYDIGDDLKLNNKQNATFLHFQNRLQMYAQEGFEIKLLKRQVKLHWN